MEDWTFPTSDEYADRPGISPVLAALRAAGRIRSTDKVLEVGCGTGMDSVGLAVSGVRSVTGIDQRASALRHAKRRAVVAGVEENVRFVSGSAYRLRQAFPGKTFDVVVDTLLGNNLAQQERYVASVAAVTRPGGLAVFQHKVALVPGASEDAPPDAPYVRWFRLGPVILTQVPSRTLAGRRGFVDVAVAVGRRRAQ